MLNVSEYNTLNTEQEEKIKALYKVYMMDIVPFFISLEISDNTYPIALLNEVRAIFTHISRCYLFKGIDIDAQIIAAERHIKRCKLDCYKYSCISCRDRIENFYCNYRGVDLTYINNGNFIKDLRMMYKKAESKIRLAKRIDTQNFMMDNDLHIKCDSPDFDNYCQAVCDDTLFTYYEDALKAYVDCVKLIDKNMENIEFLKHKATRKDIATWAFGIVGIISLIATILLSI